MSLAKAFVSGTVVKAPEKRFTQNDMAIAGFTLNLGASNTPTLVRVSAFGQLAEMVAGSIGLNDSVVVEGRLQVNSFKTPSGKDKKVYEITANAVEKMNSSTVVSQPIQQAQPSEIVTFSEEPPVNDLIDEDEIPF